MSNLITINASNIVENGLNNRFEYRFPGPNCDFKDTEIAVASISIYNTVFNVDAARYNNNRLSIDMPTGSTVSTIYINLDDGYLAYKDLSRLIQKALLDAGAVLYDADSNPVYSIQLSENPSYYAAQIDLATIPTTIGSTYTLPATGIYSSSGSGLPVLSSTPRLNIPPGFGSLIGFTTGVYPNAVSTVAVSILSNTIPIVHPVSSYSVQCNLIENKYANPSDTICAFTSGGTDIGQMINFRPNEMMWQDINPGSYSHMTITIVDQEDRYVKFNERNTLIELMIRQKKK